MARKALAVIIRFAGQAPSRLRPLSSNVRRHQHVYPLFEAAVTHIAETVKPLVFETGIPEAPYSQAGTIFLIGRKGRARGVTCRHTLLPDDLHPICLFPADGKKSFLPLTNVSYVPSNLIDEDFTDLAMVDIDIAATSRSRQGYARILNLDLQLPDWHSFCNTTDFVVLGYPRDRSFVDYDDCRIHSERVALYGRYVGPTLSPHIHTIKVEGRKGLSSFSGFSGGPVLSLLRRPGLPATMLLCGMAIQGSAESQLVHFLDASVILDATEVW